MTVEQIIPLLQDAARDRGFLSRFVQHLKAMKKELGDLRREITRHGEDHDLFIETLIQRLETEGFTRKEGPMSATKTIPQVNEELEALRKLLDELESQVETLGVCLPGEPKDACERYRELLFDQLPPDAPEQDVELAERNLQLLAPVAQMTKEVADQCQRYKDDLNGYEALGTLQHVRVMYNAGAEAEKQRERFANEARELREAKKELAADRDEYKDLCNQLTARLQEVAKDRDEYRDLCVQLTARVQDLSSSYKAKAG